MAFHFYSFSSVSHCLCSVIIQNVLLFLAHLGNLQFRFLFAILVFLRFFFPFTQSWGPIPGLGKFLNTQLNLRAHLANFYSALLQGSLTPAILVSFKQVFPRPRSQMSHHQGTDHWAADSLLTHCLAMNPSKVETLVFIFIQPCSSSARGSQLDAP